MICRSLALILVAAFLALLAPSVDAGQNPAPPTTATKTWTPPRTPWGDPDVQGVWNNSTLTPLERPRRLEGKEFFTEAEAAEATKQELQRINGDQRVGEARDDQDPATPDGRSDVGRAYNEFWRQRGTLLRRTSLIVNPADGRIPPLTPEAQRKVAARAVVAAGEPPGGPADSWEDRNLAERCIFWAAGPPMLPTTYNANAQLFQTPEYVAILNEMIHDVRIIPLDGRPHIGPGIRQYVGDSRGRWDGNTLVIDTTNFTDKTHFRGTDPTNFKGSNETLHIVERFTRTDANTLNYEFTIEDPKTFTRPWTGAIPLQKTDDHIYEYACHEGNYGMFGILSGQRAEQKAAEKSATAGSKK